ncbi:transmembrane protein 237B isoform X2 [Clupea harengus]|uniref:Transmembrane protein 237B isoform X2 n=1 Tax=Clupea harengus TaxID=7950 RepID=A0A6P8EEI9_CLUHA|nr:transmembrane protein 237B isoform X2 [Clupea harengus]
MAKRLSRGRTLPSLASQDTVDEVPRSRRKKAKKDPDGTEDMEDTGMEMGGVASRRQSVSQTPLTPEPQEVPAARKKKKKKQQTLDLEGDQAGLVNGDAADAAEQTTDAEEAPRKSRKKKKPKVVETPYVNDLDVEEDDIISDAQSPIPQHSLFSAPTGQSQPVGKMFVEHGRRFQAADRIDKRMASDQLDTNFMDIQSMWTTRDVSLKVHSGYRVIGLFAHGFLAGYAAWNVIVIYVLSGEQFSTLNNLLQQYHSLAYPSQSLLYLLLALSTVSAFDRLNLAKATIAMRSLLMLEPAALASLLYFAALVLTLSQQMTSDRINLYPSSNSTLWPPGSEHTTLYPWIGVNLAVTLMVGLAWALISTGPETDYTEEFLLSMEVEYPKPPQKADMPV